MREHWPYFQTLLDMLEMVLAKADSAIAAHYKQQLTNDPALHNLGQLLRARLEKTIHILFSIVEQQELLALTPVLKRSMTVRIPYILPLHLLQAEPMKRRRALAQESTVYDHALMVTIAGNAAGLRNTG
ncbi:MAG TPA: phosphoenolpyruvate carboxylase [Agitococcus sp.]|nr:phosphoenolpyruvate carboxylase [Agitococcus sp.]